MTVYTPTSTIGWLDLDSAASDRVATMLRALDEPATLDVLGFGVARDALSDLLSPGTSTIQTRLRYFLFLPWIFHDLARHRSTSDTATERLRTSEVRLIDRLVHLGPNNGVIGFNARSNLKRMPSEAYWGGLGAWGIRRLDLTIREYAQLAVTGDQSHHARDDDGNITVHSGSLWSRTPSPPDGFGSGPVDFDLTGEEAEFIIDAVRRHHPDSLIARYGGTDPGATALPWLLPEHPATTTLLERLRHARNFSDITLGPQWTYNVLLTRRARQELSWDTTDLEDQQRVAIADWAQTIADRYDELAGWVEQLDEFWNLIGTDTVHPRTKEFVTDLAGRAIVNAAGFADDPYVTSRIVSREAALKGKRARLTHRSALEHWNGAPFGGRFDFRWGTTSSYLRDLHAGLVGAS